jgi:hypothetical protein
MVDNQEKGRLMSEIREMRHDIQGSLTEFRTEFRGDIKDLHTKIDDRFFALDKKIDNLTTDVTTHKANLRTMGYAFGIAFTALASWVASVFKGS